MAEEVEQLLLAPFRDIVGKGKAAIQNAKSAGDRAPGLMLTAAQNLVKEGDRALKNIEPVSTTTHEEYGAGFINAVKENNDIAQFRKELVNLLWEFDDYINVDGFDPDKFDELQKASRKAAPQIWDILKRMKLHPPAPGLVSPPPSESEAPKSMTTHPRPGIAELPIKQRGARLNGLINQEVGPDPGFWRDSDDTLGTQHPANDLDRTSLRHLSKMSSDSPSTSSSMDPWQAKRPSLTIPKEGDPSGQRLSVTADSPTIPVAQLSPIRRLVNEDIVRGEYEQLVRESSRGQTSGRGSWPSPVNSRRWTSSTQSSAELVPVPPPRSDKRLNPGRDGSVSYSQGHIPLVKTISANTSPEPGDRSSKGSHDSYGHRRETSLPGNLSLVPRTMPIMHNRASHILSTHQPSTESVNSSVFDLVDTLASTNFTAPAPKQPSLRKTSKLIPLQHAGTSYPTYQGSPPSHQVPSLQPRRLSGPSVRNRLPSVDQGWIPLHTDVSASNTVATHRLEPNCAITPSSSFYKLKGFCKGAEAVRHGQVGFKKIKRPMGGFATATVAKCTHCIFELDYKAVEEDLNHESSGSRASKTVGYRVRILHKSHLPARVIDEPMYACVFCIQAGHTLEQSDATVFFTQTQLWAHLARHPRPLPKVAGVTVIEEAEIPLQFKDNFDLHFAHPPVESVMPGIAKEIFNLPTAIAVQTRKTSHGTMRLPPDRQPVLQFAIGAKIVGIEFPARYDGKWAVGWHDGVQGAFDADAVQLEAPPDAEVKMQGTSNMMAVARWKWHQKGDERWLKFDKGDVIRNISWVYTDHWCWSGSTSKASGIFPHSHLDPDSIRPNDGTPENNPIAEKKHPLRFSFRPKKDERKAGLFFPQGDLL